jgi:hypothetical protein
VGISVNQKQEPNVFQFSSQAQDGNEVICSLDNYVEFQASQERADHVEVLFGNERRVELNPSWLAGSAHSRWVQTKPGSPGWATARTVTLGLDIGEPSLEVGWLHTPRGLE